MDPRGICGDEIALGRVTGAEPLWQICRHNPRWEPTRETSGTDLCEGRESPRAPRRESVICCAELRRQVALLDRSDSSSVWSLSGEHRTPQGACGTDVLQAARLPISFC